MSYSRVNWQDDRTPLSAYNLNRMDEEIYNLSSSMRKILVGGKISGSSIASNSLSGNTIIDLTIVNNKIAEGAITDSKIYDGAVIESKLASDSVSTDKIQNNAVTESKILDGAITTSKIKNGAITSIKIAQKAVLENNIGSEGVSAGKTLVSDGEGGASWQTIPTASNTVQRIVYNGTTYNAVDGTATINQTQVDFDESDPDSPAYIKNKPSAMQLPSPTQSDAEKIIYVDALGSYALGCPNEFRMGNWLVSSTVTNGFIIKWVGGNN